LELLWSANPLFKMLRYIFIGNTILWFGLERIGSERV